jgi:hypothetical protein
MLLTSSVNWYYIGHFTEYHHQLEKLHSPPPPTHYCGDECSRPPTCYTNFKPHFNPKNYLEDIIVGENGWNKLERPCELDHKYGQIEGRDGFNVSFPEY